jgi:hypothetical protein
MQLSILAMSMRPEKYSYSRNLSSAGANERLRECLASTVYGDGDVSTLISVLVSVFVAGDGFTIVVLVSFFSAGGLFTVVSFRSQAARNAALINRQMYLFISIGRVGLWII